MTKKSRKGISRGGCPFWPVKHNVNGDPRAVFRVPMETDGRGNTVCKRCGEVVFPSRRS